VPDTPIRTFALFGGTGARTGSFSAINVTGVDPNLVSFDGPTGALTVIPEPGTVGLIGAGLIAALLRRRLRKA